MSSSSTRAGGSPRNGSSRSSGGHQGMPSARVDRRLVGRVRQRLERRDVRRRAGRADEGGPEPLRLGGDELDRHALDRHPHRAPLVLLDHRDDLGQRGEARQRRRRDPARRRPPPGARRSRASAARRRPPRRRGRPRCPPTSSQARLSSSPRCGRGSASRASASSSCASRLRPDPRHGPQPPGRRRLAQLVGRADAERPRDLDRALRAQPEVAAEADEVGRELALELRQLGDLAGLDELAQPRLDPRADPAQLAHPPGPHELGDGDRRGADRLGGAAVGAGRVGVRVGEVEQRRERVQPVGDPGVVHAGSVPLRRLGQLDRAAPRRRSGRRRHDWPDVAVRRLVQVDDHRRVIARPVALARVPVHPRRPHRSATGALARIRSIRIPRSWWNIPAR